MSRILPLRADLEPQIREDLIVDLRRLLVQFSQAVRFWTGVFFGSVRGPKRQLMAEPDSMHPLMVHTWITGPGAIDDSELFAVF